MKLYLVTCHDWEALNNGTDYDEFDGGTEIVYKAFVTKKSAEKCMKQHAKMTIEKHLDKMRKHGFDDDFITNAKRDCKCEKTDDGLSIVIPVDECEYHYNYHVKELELNL